MSSVPKASELRGLSKAELMKQLNDHKQELASLRVSQVAGATANKLTRLRTIRKAIARDLTVIHQNQRTELRKFYAKKRYVPLDLRPKKTRAIRRRLTKYEASRVTERQRKRAVHLRLRKYAVKA